MNKYKDGENDESDTNLMNSNIQQRLIDIHKM